MKDGNETPVPVAHRLLGFLSSLRFAVFLMAGLGLLGLLGLRWPSRLLSGAQWTLLGLLALGSLLAAWERRAFTWARLGFLLVHLAPLILLIGAVLNHRGGHEEVLSLPPGQWRESSSLPGYRLRLEGLRRRPSPVEHQLLAFRSSGAPGTFEGEGQAFPLKEGVQGRVQGGRTRFEVERFLWDALDQGHFAESPEAERDPLLQVVLGLGRPEPLSGYLFARNPQGCRQEEPEGRFSVVFKEAFSPDLLEALRPRPPRAERLRVELPGQTLSWPVQVGGSWKAGPFSLHVLQRLPDFEVRKGPDGEPRPGTRSQEARDPWIQLTLDPGDGKLRRLLLSARNPQQTDRLNAPHLPEGWRLRYEREGEETQRRFLLCTLADRQLRLVDQGRVLRSEALELGRPFVMAKGLSVTPIALMERPRFVPDFCPNPGTPTPGQPERSVLRLRVWDPATGRGEAQWLEVGGGPLPFLDARYAFLARPRLEPDHLEANLILEPTDGGAALALPLATGRTQRRLGTRWGLSDGVEEGRRVPMLKVLREPGGALIRLSLLMLLVGGLWMFWVKPWLKRRNEGSGGRP